MQLGGFRCPTQTVTKLVTTSYGAVINDTLIALIALAKLLISRPLGRELAHYRPHLFAETAGFSCAISVIFYEKRILISTDGNSLQTGGQSKPIDPCNS
jgi:hypothetical protein